MATKEKNTLILIIFILCGLVIGGLIGQLTQGINWLSWLSYGQTFNIGNGFQHKYIKYYRNGNINIYI